jgi:Tfp pilus assembly protein PilX
MRITSKGMTSFLEVESSTFDVRCSTGCHPFLRKGREKGFILILVLFTVLIMATLIIGLLNLTAIDAGLVKNHLCSLQAYYITEAGIADAINRIRQNGPLADTAWQQTFPAGTSSAYKVAVTDGSTLITCAGAAAPSNFIRLLQVQVNVTGGSPPYNVSIQEWKEVVP